MKKTYRYRSRNILLILALSLAGMTAANAQPFPLSENLWSNPEFKDRFLGSYGFDTEKTPQITADEQEIFKQLLPTMQSNPAAAAQRLRSVITNDSSAALDYTLANLYVQANNVPSAISAYKTAIRKFPNFYRAYRNLGLVYVNDGQYEAAIPFILKGLELGGTDGALYGPLGLCYLNLDKPKLALTAYNNALLFQPESMQWIQGKLRCIMDIGLHDDATALLEEMILEDPENMNYWKWQANTYISQKEMETAAANLEILKRLGKADIASLSLLGDIYLNEGMYPLALDNYIAAAKTGELDAQRLLRTAQGLIARRLWDEAGSYLTQTEAKLSQLEPEDQMTFRTLQARASIGTGEMAKASEILETIVAEDPMNGAALLTLADLQREQEKFDDAAFSYEQAAKVESTKVDALVQHARMLVGMRNYDDAVVLLRRAIVFSPEPRLEDFLERVDKAARVARGQI